MVKFSFPITSLDEQLLFPENIKFLSFEKDRVYQIRFTLTAFNSIGQATAEIRIDPANITVIDLPVEVIKSFSISREENTSNLVNIKLNLIIILK